MINVSKKSIFGEKIKELLSEKQITQKQLANDLNMAVTTLSGYINHNHEPDFNTLCVIASYFDVSTDYLLGRTEITKPIETHLTDKEIELIMHYRSMSSERKMLLIEQAKMYCYLPLQRINLNVSRPAFNRRVRTLEKKIKK